MHDAQQLAYAVASVRLVIKQQLDFIEAPGGLAKMLSGNGSTTKNMREYENVRKFKNVSHFDVCPYLLTCANSRLHFQGCQHLPTISHLLKFAYPLSPGLAKKVSEVDPAGDRAALFSASKFDIDFRMPFFRISVDLGPKSVPILAPFLHHSHIFGITFSTLVFASFLDRLFIDFCTPGTSKTMLLHW